MLLNLGMAAIFVGGAAAARPAGDDERSVVVATMSIWADVVGQDRAVEALRHDLQRCAVL